MGLQRVRPFGRNMAKSVRANVSPFIKRGAPIVTKKILVTGGAGFLGSHLCRKLLSLGDTVVCLDNLTTGTKDNIFPLLDHERFEFMTHDIVQPFSMDVDEIYNLAGIASPAFYAKFPIETTMSCVYGAINVLEIARACGARILQASTSEIYGDPEVHPQPETYAGNVSVTGPRACYDEGKRCAESLFFDYHRQFGIDIKVMRIFNTYGPRLREDDGRVISNFVIRALSGEPLILHGEGTQTRAFCYVDDMINGMIAFMQSPKAIIGPMNFGNPQEIAIRDLAELVIELTGSTSVIDSVAQVTDDPRRRCPDIELARSEICWAPTTDLRTGLLALIEHYRGVLDRAS